MAAMAMAAAVAVTETETAVAATAAVVATATAVAAVVATAVETAAEAETAQSLEGRAGGGALPGAEGQKSRIPRVPIEWHVPREALLREPLPRFEEPLP